MKCALLVLFAACSAVAIVAPAVAQEAVGDWFGVVDVAPGNLKPLLVHIARDDAGVLNGTMDSPTQGARRVPLDKITARGARLTFAVPGLDGHYDGEWDAGNKAWRGKWSQGEKRWSLALSVAPPPVSADWLMPPDAEIARLIADRNAPRPGQGIVIGVLEPEGKRVVAGGTGVGANVDRNTLFEIGSISKVFTGLLLADMVNKGEVALEDPAAKYLPEGHRMPERNGRQITLRDLSTHRSGLPRMADDMDRIDSPDGPFARYGEDKVLAFLDRYQLTREIGSQYEYSNLGGGLLGYLLGRAAHSDYETLLRERITGPLGMKDTVITMSDSDAARLAPPFDPYMRPTKPWNLGVLAGAGGIRSNVADMLLFAQAAIDPNSPIADAMKTALSVRSPGPDSTVEQALGWEVAHLAGGRELLMHGGQSGGFQSKLILEPAKGRAVVALSNSRARPAPDDIVFHVLVGTQVAPTQPLPSAPMPRYAVILLAFLIAVLALWGLHLWRSART